MSSDKKQKRDPFKYYKRLAKEWDLRTQSMKVPKLWKLKTTETQHDGNDRKKPRRVD